MVFWNLSVKRNKRVHVQKGYALRNISKLALYNEFSGQKTSQQLYEFTATIWGVDTLFCIVIFRRHEVKQNGFASICNMLSIHARQTAFNIL
jgi:hypothetical protein